MKRGKIFGVGLVAVLVIALVFGLTVGVFGSLEKNVAEAAGTVINTATIAD